LVVRKIDIATGVSTIFAGQYTSAGRVDEATSKNIPLGDIQSIAGDSNYLYILNNTQNIIKIAIATGEVTPLAGQPEQLHVNGVGTVARLDQPTSITTDGTYLYVVDRSFSGILGVHLIRKIEIATALVSDFSISFSPSNDRYFPNLITTDGRSLFGDGKDNLVNRYDIGTGVTSVLETPGNNLNSLVGITTDNTGFFKTEFNRPAVYRVDLVTGVSTKLAGDINDSADGNGTAARFRYPYGITTDGTNLYMTDIYDYTIRKIVIATGAVSTIAGSAGVSGSTDGTGTAARFNDPRHITTDGTNLYVVDGASTIRKIVISTKKVTTLALMEVITGTLNKNNFTGITTDGISLYVTSGNSVLKIQ
jgi:hypothetical protein